MSKDMRELLAGYVDGELSTEERKAFEAELENNPELKAELEEFRKLKEVTSMVKYADLPLEVWENYWQSLYRKLERGFGWILFSVGAIVLLSFVVFEFFHGMYINPGIPMLIKVGVTAVTIGAVILAVSFIRETIFAYQRDRYKEVIR